jgi:hypothetical protein
VPAKCPPLLPEPTRRYYETQLGDNPQEWGSPAAKGRFHRNAEEETIRLSHPVKARYLKFVALSEQSGQPFATVAELEVEEANSGTRRAIGSLHEPHLHIGFQISSVLHVRWF